MTGEEALGILGLTQPDAAAIRAAYLRLIRMHKPDTDPEGFRQVRSAYELLTRPSVVGKGQPRFTFRADLMRPPPPPSSTSPASDLAPRRKKERPEESLAGRLRSIGATNGASAAEVDWRIRKLPPPSPDEASPELTLRALHGALGRLLAAGHRSAALRLLGHFQTWLAVHGPSGNDPIPFRTAWAMRVELTRLHPDFPTAWVQRLAAASERGDYQAFLEEISRPPLGKFSQRSKARQHLPRSGFLRELLAPRLAPRAGRFRLPDGPRFVRSFRVWAIILVSVSSLRMLASWTETAERTSRSWTVESPYLVEQQLNARFGSAQAEIARNCGQTLSSLECARATTVLEELAWAQCPRADADVARLPSGWSALRQAFLERCVGLMSRRDGLPAPRLAYRPELELAMIGLCQLAQQSHQSWWCQSGEKMVSELKSEDCPGAKEVLTDFQNRLVAAPPASPFDQAVASDLRRAESTIQRHCGEQP
jgi:hypothetical protein